MILGLNMLSDESSSDSETGRFKCKSSNQEEHKKNIQHKDDSSRFSGRDRPLGDRFRRDLDKQRDERDRFNRHDRDRHRYSRHSPVSRRRHSRDRSPGRSYERYRHSRDSRGRSKPKEYRKEHRSISKERQIRSRSHSHKPADLSRDSSGGIQSIKDEKKERHSEKSERKSPEKCASSPDNRGKRSEIHKPSPTTTRKRKSDSPIIVEHSDDSEEVKPGSYYSMIPAIVKEKSEESSEIDSSDDEKLRAKLLNLEKELHKTKKKKHKKKHKRKSSKSSKDREQEPITTVEVSSTTDIQDNSKSVEGKEVIAVAEVSSTQKSSQKESCEEGEISSDENTENNFEIDPNDLRHKLKRSGPKRDSSKEKSLPDVCGPALPPHLKSRFSSSDAEGPILPPHLKSKSKHIGMYFINIIFIKSFILDKRYLLLT